MPRRSRHDAPVTEPTTEATGARWDRSVTALLLSVFCASSAAFAGVTALGIQVFDLTGPHGDIMKAANVPPSFVITGVA